MRGKKLGIILLFALCALTGCSNEDGQESVVAEKEPAQVEVDAKLDTFMRTCEALKVTLKDDLATDKVATYVVQEDTVFPQTLLESEKERLPEFEITSMNIGYDTSDGVYACVYKFENLKKETSFITVWYSSDGVTFDNYIITPMTAEVVIGELNRPTEDEDGQYQQPNFGWLPEEPDYIFSDPEETHSIQTTTTAVANTEPVDTEEQADESNEPSEPNENGENGELDDSSDVGEPDEPIGTIESASSAVDTVEAEISEVQQDET